MELLSKKWIKYKGSKIKYERKGNTMVLRNDSNEFGFVMIPRPYTFDNINIKISFKGKAIDGNSAILYLLDAKRNILLEQTINSTAYKEFDFKATVVFAIKVLAHSEVVISEVDYDLVEQVNILENLNNDILVVSPNYPTMENKYMCGFVHSRLVGYKESGIKFDLIVCHWYNEVLSYNFEGIDVLRMPFNKLREVLQKKKYKKILLHFFDEQYAKVLDACNLTDTDLYFWVHGPETLYWDWSKFMTPYFDKPYELTNADIKILQRHDEMINRYNAMKNVKWIFVSEWIKNRSEELIGTKFNNYEVIPNIIDSDTFDYVEKDAEKRKKVFFLRRFDDCNKYAIDVNVRAILELSKRPCFEDMEFNIYGTGSIYDKLVAPLRKFSNVHLYPKFLSHEEISAIHKENGIALFATRYDAQGVSMCEAAMSGLAIVSSQNDAIKEFIPNDMGLLAEEEDYRQFADIIEELYNDEEKFKRASKECYKKVFKKCSFKETIQKEIDMIKHSTKEIAKESTKVPSKNIILSVVVPSYNVEQYLEHTVNTILNHHNAHKMEVIIVNDGSKDNTLDVAKAMVRKYGDLVKIIDKENGGHGSAINAGLAAATAKYVRLIDGDDWVNSIDLCELIDILSKEESDIVLTNYSEDRAVENQIIYREHYKFMTPGLTYQFDDLCYDGYGFNEWGPILATGNFKTKMLQDLNFKISEKCFYVDMEFDMYSIIRANTISFYPLDIYRYFIGRSDQSVSQKSFIRNRAQHEKVLFNLIDYIYKNDMSEQKKNYIVEKLIHPMIKSHYIIVSEYLHNISEFNDFDQRLKKYPEMYNYFVNRYTRLLRKSKGLLLPFGPLMIKLFRKG